VSENALQEVVLGNAELLGEPVLAIEVAVGPAARGT
jgi:hypothetical protein